MAKMTASEILKTEIYNSTIKDVLLILFEKKAKNEIDEKTFELLFKDIEVLKK